MVEQTIEAICFYISIWKKKKKDNNKDEARLLNCLQMLLPKYKA